jgi:acetoin utilization deacetylase AcuC-like enzyme
MKGNTMAAIFFNDKTTQTIVYFDTTKKGADVARALSRRGYQITIPEPVTSEILERYHTPAYISAIETGEPLDLAESQNFAWDPHTWTSVTAQTGAMVAAVHAALRDGRAYALASGFHHASRARGGGFCTFNGIAIAAGEALAAGARHVFILDFDAHGGGGTHDIIAGWDHVMHYDMTTATYEAYTPTAPHRRVHVHTAATYLPTVNALLAELDAQVQPGDVVLYNAGMDSYEGCDIGGLTGITSDMLRTRDALVDAWVRRHNLKIAACLAGGYQGKNYPNELLIQLHRESVERICAD